MSDEPIDEQSFLHGVTVVDIGDIRVSRGLTRRPVSSCSHRRMSYDPKERRIWCRDCEKDVDAFDAFKALSEQAHAANEKIQREWKAVQEAASFQMRTRAAKEVDEAWRSRKMVPACPHCSNGLFPEDFVNGVGMVGREFALARRGKKVRT